MKRIWAAIAAALVVCASFVKVFPFSGILFGVAAALILSLPRWRATAGQWFGRPRSIAWCVAAALVVLVLDLASSTGLIMALAHTPYGAPNLSRFQELKGNPQALALWLAGIWTVVAFGEEIISRGFLLDRLRDAFGASRAADVVAVLASAITFGAVHYYQGVSGMALNAVTGVLYGTLYLSQRRNLWANVLVHGLSDSVALVAFYFGYATG